MKYPIDAGKKEPIGREDGEFSQAVTTFRNRVRLRQEETSVCPNAILTVPEPKRDSSYRKFSECTRTRRDFAEGLLGAAITLNECFETGKGYQYEVVGKLGQGVFGQVLKCVSSVKGTSGLKPEEKAAPEIEEENGLELLFDSEEGERWVGKIYIYNIELELLSLDLVWIL